MSALRQAGRRWLERRLALAEDAASIATVRHEARLLLEELEARRDGRPGRKLTMTHLLRAIREVA